MLGADGALDGALDGELDSAPGSILMQYLLLFLTSTLPPYG